MSAATAATSGTFTRWPETDAMTEMFRPELGECEGRPGEQIIEEEPELGEESEVVGDYGAGDDWARKRPNGTPVSSKTKKPILVSSAAARNGIANHEALGAAKAGIIGLTLECSRTDTQRPLSTWRNFIPSITPPWLNLAAMGKIPYRMHPGMVIRYRVKPLLGVPVNRIAEITHVDAPHYFVDEQRFGPCRFWHHLPSYE